MTDIMFDEESFKNLQDGAYETEGMSERLEQESRRYSRRLGEENEARLR